MPRPTRDITGQRFDKLLVINKIDGFPTKWHCRCDCGQERDIRACNLLNGHTTSCGCKAHENWKKALPIVTKHGHCRTGKLTCEYKSWRGAKQRCVDPAVRGWKNYGGRGIIMCPHWIDSFSQFLADMGPRPKSRTIERIDNNKGYLCPLCCPLLGNCRWATMSDQIKNQRHEEFHDKRSRKRTSWWMAQSKKYRHDRAVAAARARWGRVRHAAS